MSSHVRPSGQYASLNCFSDWKVSATAALIVAVVIFNLLDLIQLASSFTDSLELCSVSKKFLNFSVFVLRHIPKYDHRQTNKLTVFDERMDYVSQYLSELSQLLIIRGYSE